MTNEIAVEVAETVPEVRARRKAARMNEVQAAPAAPSLSAADRLRAFEDEILGPNAPRHAGLVERGSGSLYMRMEPEQKAYHSKLEKVVETEAKLAAAEAALAAAHVAYEATLKEVANGVR